ncbi:hypothetical protein G6661_01740 [Polynucleobacter paneuropaeus]|nr:hypothetical protein G6661_01740 [Polynucleobacter paneuropaeus]
MLDISNLFYTVLNYFQFILAIFLSFFWDSKLVFFVLSFSTLIFLKFCSEFLHEATHFNFVAKRSINDWLAKLLFAPWIFTTLDSNRKNHFLHHGANRYFDKFDPDTSSSIYWFKCYQMKRLPSAIVILSDTAIQIKNSLLSNSAEKKHVWLAALPILYYSSLFSLLACSIHSVLNILCVSITVAFLYPINSKLRVLTQHVNKFGQKSFSRNIPFGPIECIFFNSDFLRFHELHHGAPGLRWQKLREVYGLNNKNELIEITTMDLIRGWFK